MLKFVDLSYCNLSVMIASSKSFLLIVSASWCKNEELLVLEQLEKLSLVQQPIIYRITSTGSDDIEEYAIYSLNLSELPCVVLYSEGSIQQIISYLERFSICNTLQSVLRNKPINCFDSNYEKVVNALLSSAIDEPIHLFVSGDRSSVGKSTICLAILASLLKLGFSGDQLAYIKPSTQCEAEQPVTRFCTKNGIDNNGIGPIVFFQGFTRAYLAGETSTAPEMLASVRAAVATIAAGKKIVVIDGVGYPAVGSICNVSNADVAASLKAPVVLIGKSGVGDAVDSYNLNSCFFQSKGVSVLGGIFNKLPLEGFYSVEACKTAVSFYFTKFKPHEMPYGFMPVLNFAENTSIGIMIPTFHTFYYF